MEGDKNDNMLNYQEYNSLKKMDSMEPIQLLVVDEEPSSNILVELGVELGLSSRLPNNPLSHFSSQFHHFHRFNSMLLNEGLWWLAFVGILFFLHDFCCIFIFCDVLALFVSQIVSNEEYKSAQHRVLANCSNEARVSVAVFLNPGAREDVYGPLPELTSADKPAKYRSFTLNEFLTRFFRKELDDKSLTNFFRT